MQGEISTSSLKIDKLRHRILDGNIKIPPFQREFVWKQEQIIDLLDSIIRDYPIGSILLWETKDDLPAKRNIGGYSLPEPAEDYPMNYVLDGQQRVTSIFSVFQDANSSQDSQLFDVFYDINNGVFVSKIDIEDKSKMLPLKLIFNNSNFIKFIQNENLESSEIYDISNLQSIFQNYEIPTVTIKKKDKAEVGIIFERINNTGTPLSTLDLMTAWTWSEEFHLQEKFDEILDILESKNFGNLQSSVILQCAGAIINKTTKKKSILELESMKVKENIEILKTSLEKAIDYLSTQFYCASDNFLPRVQQIVPLCYIFSQLNSLNFDQSESIKKWFWRTSFSNRYSASTDSKMDDDILFMDKIINKQYTAINNYHSEISSEKLSQLKFSKSNSFVRAFILLLAQNQPKDLVTNNQIDVGSSLSSYNRKEYHHIFPRAFLKDQGYNTHQTNRALNFCFLSASSNKIINNNAPSDYFRNIIDKNIIKNVLESNMIPISDMNIYFSNNYESFIETRSILVMNYIKFLTGE